MARRRRSRKLGNSAEGRAVLVHDLAVVEQQARHSTKLWRHPDREVIEEMLTKRSARWVEKWLMDRYPLDGDESVVRFNQGMRMTRKALIEYRDRYLVAESFQEPIEDSPLEEALPKRVPKREPQYELEGMARRIEAAEFFLAKCLRQDEELGMTQEITLAALEQLGKAYRERAELAMRLGVAGYEEAARKLSVEERSLRLNINENHEGEKRRDPRDPDRYDLAKALLGLPEHKRRELLALPPMPEREEVAHDVLPPLAQIIEMEGTDGGPDDRRGDRASAPVQPVDGGLPGAQAAGWPGDVGGERGGAGIEGRGGPAWARSQEGAAAQTPDEEDAGDD